MLGILARDVRISRREPVSAKELLVRPAAVRNIERTVREVNDIIVDHQRVRASLSLQVLDDISRRLNREAHHVVLNDIINVALQLIRRAIAVRSKERAVHAPKLIVLQKLLAESSSIDVFPIPPSRRRRRAAGGIVIVSLYAG